MSKIIGIDLGTTNSCVAVMEGNEEDMGTRSYELAIDKRRNAVRVAAIDEGRKAAHPIAADLGFDHLRQRTEAPRPTRASGQATKRSRTSSGVPGWWACWSFDQSASRTCASKAGLGGSSAGGPGKG